MPDRVLVFIAKALAVTTAAAFGGALLALALGDLAVAIVLTALTAITGRIAWLAALLESAGG